MTHDHRCLGSFIWLVQHWIEVWTLYDKLWLISRRLTTRWTPKNTCIPSHSIQDGVRALNQSIVELNKCQSSISFDFASVRQNKIAEICVASSSVHRTPRVPKQPVQNISTRMIQFSDNYIRHALIQVKRQLSINNDEYWIWANDMKIKRQ